MYWEKSSEIPSVYAITGDQAQQYTSIRYYLPFDHIKYEPLALQYSNIMENKYFLHLMSTRDLTSLFSQCKEIIRFYFQQNEASQTTDDPLKSIKEI